MTTLRWEGTEALNAALSRIRIGTWNAGQTWAKRTNKKIFDLSQVYVPVDTEALKKSGHVTGPEIIGMKATYGIEYGNDEVDYAVYVHENPEAYHEPPTSYKFVERAFTETTGDTANDLGLTMRSSMQKDWHN